VTTLAARRARAVLPEILDLTFVLPLPSSPGDFFGRCFPFCTPRMVLSFQLVMNRKMAGPDF
jgi:hypothetical protein